jgi:hypothetical protein
MSFLSVIWDYGLQYVPSVYIDKVVFYVRSCGKEIIMSWKLKVELAVRSGKTREEALEAVCEEMFQANKALDERLAKAFDYLTERQLREVMGDLS